jgi:hypothetical protein
MNQELHQIQNFELVTIGGKAFNAATQDSSGRLGWYSHRKLFLLCTYWYEPFTYTHQ